MTLEVSDPILEFHHDVTRPGVGRFQRVVKKHVDVEIVLLHRRHLLDAELDYSYNLNGTNGLKNYNIHQKRHMSPKQLFKVPEDL